MMSPKTAADHTGDGAIHSLYSILGIRQCKWFQVSAVTIASTAARVGDSDIAMSSRGIPIVSGGGVFAPPIAADGTVYDLETWYVIAANSDKLSIAAAF